MSEGSLYSNKLCSNSRKTAWREVRLFFFLPYGRLLLKGGFQEVDIFETNLHILYSVPAALIGSARSQGRIHHRQGTQKYPQPIFSPVSLPYSHGSAGLAAQTLHPRRSRSLLRRVRRQAWRLLEHDRDDVMLALQNAYWMAKERNKETYASKKYRKDGEA